MISVILPQYDRTLKLQEGESLLELFQREGFFLQSDCAGVGTCGKCKIKLLNCDYPLQNAECKHLSNTQIKQGMRLSCRVFPSKECSVEFLITEEVESDQILTESQRQKIKINPSVQMKFLNVEEPELAYDQFDFESIQKFFKKNDVKRNIAISLLNKIPKTLRENEYKVTLIYNDSHFIDIEAGISGKKIFGLAIDIGTTTLVAKLIDLKTGLIKAISSGLNPQQRIGADVISRIGYSQKRKNAFLRLQKVLVDKLNLMIRSITVSSGIAPDQIYDVTVVGNSVMGHLFLALDSTNLALAPYTPVVKHYPAVSASEIGLSVNPRASISLLPNIGRFVGSDTTAVILATGVDKSEKMTLLVDIGTNGEIVLGNKHKMLATSTAAGPAFEGARIRFGMRATEGAIDRVEIKNGVLKLHTIQNKNPKGICGSGIICLIGELLKSGVISWTGQLITDNKENVVSKSIFNRLGFEDKEAIFALYSSNDQNVFLTQRDVREIQLAKSAIRTGINLLISELGITKNDLDRILLAGAFGNFLDREQAIRIGLLPDIELEKIRFIGNAACAGAELVLLSKEMKNRAEKIADETQYFEIATHPEFYDQYTENMLFPTKNSE